MEIYENVEKNRYYLNKTLIEMPYLHYLWYIYVIMEQTLGHIDLTRIIFERWMKQKPKKTGLEYVHRV